MKMCYYYNTGILDYFKTDSNGCFRVKFYPTEEGRITLINNFYNISELQPQKGIDVSFLTHQQRREEVHRNHYPE